MVGPVTFSAEDKLREVEIEIGFRRGVYKRQVGYGKMRQEDADRRIALMQGIALDYARLAVGFKAVTEEAIAQALYEAEPIIDGGEALDGFQVTPPGPLKWSSVIEMDADRPYRASARVVLELLRAKGVLSAA